MTLYHALLTYNTAFHPFLLHFHVVFVRLALICLLFFFPSHFFFALLWICITCRSLRDEEFSLPLIKIDQSKAKTNTMVNKYLKTPTPRPRRLCLLEWKLQRLLCFRSDVLYWTMLATPNYSKRYKNQWLFTFVPWPQLCWKTLTRDFILNF